MNRKLSNVLLFTAGVAVGSLATWRYFKTKYEVVEDEIEEKTEETEETEGESEEESPEVLESKMSYKKPPLKEYVKMVESNGYVPKTHMEEVEEEIANGELGDKDVYEPFIIRPDEYGELHAYETLSLNYYADGVLTDELDNPIEDVESLVPADFADHFGEYDDNAVFVRNDNLECDYEILRDLRKFTDVVGEYPYPTEDE